jgi:hypothetical protein
MKKLFSKNSLSSTSPSPALPSHTSSNRAQVAWSLCVAIAVAIVALEQARGSHRGSEPALDRAIATQASAPQTLVTGKPVTLAQPLSQEELTTPQNQLQ